MKRIALISMLSLIAVLASACASSAPAADPVTQSAPAAGTSAAVPTIGATTTAATTGITAAAPASNGGTQVAITLADNTIQSSLTTFQVGVAYTFVITNNGQHAHNFNISPPVSISGNLDASLAQALLVVGKEKLPVGGSATVTYTFPDSAVGMQLEFSCLIPRHYEDGMRLAISVTK